MMEKVYIDTDNRVEVTELQDVETEILINDATVKLSLFKDAEGYIDCSALSFTSGGIGVPEVGQVVKGVTGAATAVIKAIVLLSGAWLEGDAVGYLELLDQIGTFQAENLNIIGGQANIATVAGDSSGAETADAGASTWIPIYRHTLTTDSYIYVQGTKNYDGYHTPTDVALDKIKIGIAYVAERFSGNESYYTGIKEATDISMTHEEGDDDGYYDGVLPDTMIGLHKDVYYARIIRVTKGATILTIKQRCKAQYYLDEGS